MLECADCTVAKKGASSAADAAIYTGQQAGVYWMQVLGAWPLTEEVGCKGNIAQIEMSGGWLRQTAGIGQDPAQCMSSSTKTMGPELGITSQCLPRPCHLHYVLPEGPTWLKW